MKEALCALILGLILGAIPVAQAADADAPERHLTLANNKFDPQELTIPAHEKIKLIVTNKDSSAAEFESDELRREKVIPANGEIHIYLGPLDPGTYGYYDDFHRSTTTGKIIAK